MGVASPPPQSTHPGSVPAAYIRKKNNWVLEIYLGNINLYLDYKDAFLMYKHFSSS